MKLSIETIRNAVLFQNGAIGDFLMAIYLAELLRESGCVERITIIVPRNLNFLQGLIESYPHISIVEISRRRGWAQLLKMTRGPTLVTIQPARYTAPEDPPLDLALDAVRKPKTAGIHSPRLLDAEVVARKAEAWAQAEPSQIQPA